MSEHTAWLLWGMAMLATLELIPIIALASLCLTTIKQFEENR